MESNGNKFRFLLVEDDEPTLINLEKLLEESFPGCEVDVANCEDRALELVEEAIRNGKEYQIAILDCMLPKEAGSAKEIKFFASREIRKQIPDILTIHITGYEKSPEVSDYIKEQTKVLDCIGEQRLADVGFFLLSKKNTLWSVELIRRIREWTYGNRISSQMDDIFQDSARMRRPRRGSKDGRLSLNRRRGITQRLASLAQDIVDHWDDLDDDLKDRIRDVFKVDETRSPIRISIC